MGEPQHSSCLPCACQRLLCQVGPLEGAGSAKSDPREDRWPKLMLAATCIARSQCPQFQPSVVPGCPHLDPLSTWLAPGCPQEETSGYVPAREGVRRMEGPSGEVQVSLKTSPSAPAPVCLSRTVGGQTGRGAHSHAPPRPACKRLPGTCLPPAQLAAAEPQAGFHSLFAAQRASDRCSTSPKPQPG